MKIQNLSSGLIAALVLSSPIVGAEDYPAANFQPTVIYSDVPEDSAASASTSKGEKSQPDSNYPAANFQPTTIYSDTDYKHQTSTASQKETASSSSSSASVSSVNEEIAGTEESEDDSMVTLLGLAALAIVGFVLLKRKSSSKLSEKPVRRARTTSNPKKPRHQTDGATGVARYLSKNMPELSSVALYLKNKNNVQASGVSKYMAKRIVAAKVAAVAKRTGVEKYLRDRG